MEKYIIKILENNNRVIVPEFGAFIVKQRNPLTIVFNEFLQYNDGMLVDFISKNEGLSRDDSKSKIDAFVAEVAKSIEKNSSFTMSKLGVIKKSSTGKISIEQESTTAKSAEKESKPASKVTSKTEEAKEEKTSAIEPDIKEELPKEEIPEQVIASKATTEVKEQKTIIKDPPVEPEKKETPKKTAESQEKPSVSETATTKTDQQKPETEEPKKALEKEAEPAPRLKPAAAPVPLPQKRKRTNVIWWIIIIVIVNGILISYFLFKGDLGSILNSKEDTETIDYLENEILLPEEPVEDAAKEKAVQPDELVTEPAPEPTTPVVSSPKKTITGTRYYIIAGAFQNENNADNLVIELKAKGYNSEKIGKNGNLHLVSYDVFQTKADADRSLRKIKKEVDPEAWIRTVK